MFCILCFVKGLGDSVSIIWLFLHNLHFFMERIFLLVGVYRLQIISVDFKLEFIDAVILYPIVSQAK